MARKKSAGQRRTDKRRRREKRRKSQQARHQPKATAAVAEPSLLPPITLDANGAVMPDPYALLSVAQGASHDQIRAAYRTQLVAHPPEQEPTLARQLREARDHLLDPEQVMLRAAMPLRLPDPAPLEAGLRQASPPAPRLEMEERIVGQAMLYALVEDALAAEGALLPPPTRR